MNLKKDLAIVGGLFLVVVGLLVFGKEFTSVGTFGTGSDESTQSAVVQRDTDQQDGKIDIILKSLTVRAEVADTKDERQNGLSGRESMAISEGLLFIFEKSDDYGIWMKDMQFPIDIIWISADKKIVDIAQNALPEPGTDDDELTIYRPQGEALYILEINAGLAGAHQLQAGDEVNFEL